MTRFTNSECHCMRWCRDWTFLCLGFCHFVCHTHNTHFSECSCYGRCAFINCSAIFLHHHFKTGELPSRIGLIVTERHSDLRVNQEWLHHTNQHAICALNSHTIPFRGLCVAKLVWLVWVLLTVVSSILVVSSVLSFDGFYGASAVKMSLLSRQCANENYTFCTV